MPLMALVCLLSTTTLTTITGVAAASQKSSSGNDDDTTFYNIGGVLSTNASELHFAETISVSIYIYKFYTDQNGERLIIEFYK